MGRVLNKCLGALVVMLAFSACAELQRRDLPGPAEAEDSGFASWSLVVDGTRIEELGADRARLNELLRDLRGINIDNKEALAALLERIADGRAADEAVPRALQGIAGFSTAQFLRAAVLNQTTEIRGKIQRYYFNDYTAGGYLEVNTIVTRFENGAPVRKDRYLWAIGIRPGTYKVHRKSNDPHNPFPGTVKISDPNMLADMARRGLDHKLYAKGEGIVVLGVLQNGNLLPLNHPYYRSTAESCIDLLFKGYPPESELPEQSGYCLGRCDHPQVVNTR